MGGVRISIRGCQFTAGLILIDFILLEYMDKGYMVICFRTAVLCIKKELPVSEYKDRSYIVTRHGRVVVVSLISHSYSD